MKDRIRPGPRCRALLGVFLLLASPTIAKNQKPVVCDSPVPYRGAPLHADFPLDLLTGPDRDLGGEFDSLLAGRLASAVSWILQKTGAPAITAAVGIPGHGIWAVSRGADTGQPPVPSRSPEYFHWASAGKMFTASVVMQLIEERKMSFDDPLSKWFSDFPNARAITIEHLLTHTSGTFSFNSDPAFHRKKGYSSPEECIRVAAERGSGSCPGQGWGYSNTGYVLLARIIEKVENRPFHEVVAARLIRPLGLKRTVALAPKQILQGLAVGHVKGRADPLFDPSTPFGAGNIASSAEDMVVFWHGFLSGKILGADMTRQAFGRLYPMFEPGLFYGRGVMLSEFTDAGTRRTWLGHSGGTPALKAVVAYDVAARVLVAVALNADVSAEASANKLLKEVLAHRTGEASGIPDP